MYPLDIRVTACPGRGSLGPAGAGGGARRRAGLSKLQEALSANPPLAL